MLVEMGLFAQGIAIAHTNRGLSKTQCCEAQVPDTGLVHLIREMLQPQRAMGKRGGSAVTHSFVLQQIQQ